MTIMHAVSESPGVDVSADRETLTRDGIVGLKGAFSRDWAERMREDMWRSIRRPSAASPISARAAMCRAVLGHDYKIVEIGFDTPFEGAMNQPWHRDFPSPVETWRDHRITSLAFNLTGVDVTPDMGPFEIALGTQWDDGRAWKHEMFPSEDVWSRFAERGVRKFPQMGDISCRSALTIHRGTTHRSPIARPVLVLCVDAPGAGHDKLHDLMVTQDFYDALPPIVRDHLACRVVEQLIPVTQKHDIEGLVMGVA
jgi:hypothetical protein